MLFQVLVGLHTLLLILPRNWGSRQAFGTMAVCRRGLLPMQRCPCSPTGAAGCCGQLLAAEPSLILIPAVSASVDYKRVVIVLAPSCNPALRPPASAPVACRGRLLLEAALE